MMNKSGFSYFAVCRRGYVVDGWQFHQIPHP
jgi:hypothetical protein